MELDKINVKILFYQHFSTNKIQKRYNILWDFACSEIPIAQKIKVFGMPSRNYIQFNFTKIDKISLIKLTDFKNNLNIFFFVNILMYYIYWIIFMVF